MKNRTGYISADRLKYGAGIFRTMPVELIPGMGQYLMKEDFLGLPATVVASNPLILPSGTWRYSIQNAAAIIGLDGAGGLATITCGGADNDLGQIIYGETAAVGNFVPAANKDIWFSCRLRSTNLGTAQINLFAGLIRPPVLDTAILADDGAAFPLQNMLGFAILDTETTYHFVSDKAGVQGYNGTAIALDTNYHTMGFYLHGLTDIHIYIDGNEIAAAVPTIATQVPVVGLMPAMAIKAGSGAAEILTIDYIIAGQLS